MSTTSSPVSVIFEEHENHHNTQRDLLRVNEWLPKAEWLHFQRSPGLKDNGNIILRIPHYMNEGR
jgi:hypothetical protein